jgi:hypothetical protein
MSRADDAAPAERPAGFVPVGGPLSPAEAGFLEFELGQDGIDSFTHVVQGDPGDGARQQVEVAPADLAAALEVRERILADASAEPPPGSSRNPRSRNALFAAILGFVAALRVGRIIHPGPLVAVAAVLLSVTLYLGVSRSGAATTSGDDPEPPTRTRTR